MEQRHKYRGYVIIWQEPPSSHEWQSNIGSDDHALFKRMGGKIEIVNGTDRANMLAKSEEYIDAILEG